MSESVDSDFPSELRGKLSDLHRGLDSVQSVLEPLFSGSFADAREKNDVLDRAKLDLVAAYSLNSLFWIYLNIKGESPQDHGIKQELERIRSYMVKVKALMDKTKAPRLDPNLAKRFVRNALWKPKEKNGAKGKNANTHLEKRETSDAEEEPPSTKGELKIKQEASKRSREVRLEKKNKRLRAETKGGQK